MISKLFISNPSSEVLRLRYSRGKFFNCVYRQFTKFVFKEGRNLLQAAETDG